MINPSSNPKSVANQLEGRWMLAVSPLIWVTHLLATYLTVALWRPQLELPPGTLGPIQGVVWIYTVIALASMAATGWWGYRRQHAEITMPGAEEDVLIRRYRSLGFATVILSIVSGVATLIVAFAAPYMAGSV